MQGKPPLSFSRVRVLRYPLLRECTVPNLGPDIILIPLFSRRAAKTQRVEDFAFCMIFLRFARRSRSSQRNRANVATRNDETNFAKGPSQV